jgi:hypothetical protein
VGFEGLFTTDDHMKGKEKEGFESFVSEKFSLSINLFSC